LRGLHINLRDTGMLDSNSGRGGAIWGILTYEWASAGEVEIGF